MNPELAEMYGTVEGSEDDLEKTAAIEMLVKIADAEGVDLDDFEPEQLEDMVFDLMSGDEVYEEEDDFQEKVAEADYLGRVMAHSMTQELGNIEEEKYASVGTAAFKVKHAPGKAFGAVKKYLGDVSGHSVKAREARKLSITRGESGKRKALEKARDLAQKRTKQVGIGTALTLAGAGGAKELMSKKSAMDELAEQRAYEMLAEAGYLEEEKVASSLDEAVEMQALEILEANGYPVDWE